MACVPDAHEKHPPPVSEGWFWLTGVAPLIALLCVAPGALAQERVVNRDLSHKKIVVHQLLLLPPSVAVIRAGIRGGSPVVEESQSLATFMRAATAQVLIARGCSVKALIPTAPAPGAENKERQYALADFQKSFDSLLVKMKKNPDPVAKGRFSLGDEVLNLNDDGAADGLLFARAAGVTKTGAEKAFDLALGGWLFGSMAAADRLTLYVAIVDARTGLVLYYGKAFADGLFLSDGDVSLHAARDSLEEFPCAPAGAVPSAQKQEKR